MVAAEFTRGSLLHLSSPPTAGKSTTILSSKTGQQRPRAISGSLSGIGSLRLGSALLVNHMHDLITN